MENNEDFWLRYYNGSSWSTLKEWKRGTDFNNNTFYSATVTINASDVNFVNNARFRFQCDASGNADHIYIDKVKITGIGAGARNAGGDTLVALRSLDTHREGGTLEEEFAVYPNPVKGNTLFVKVLEESNADYKIINMLGQVVKKGKLSKQIDVGNLQSGIYLFEINDIDEKITRKFVKK
nr:T9SS type A sorting domain-containing protein [uncultured Tenacibaculum sp.]